MSNRWPGGLIRKTPVTPTVTSAVGVWTLAEALYWTKQGQWPTPSDPDFDYVSLLLPGNGTNGAQNNTFLDSSTNNFTITRNGDTTQGSFSPYGDLWSNYFDGTGDSLSVANAASSLSQNNFTIEAWVFPSTAKQQSVAGSLTSTYATGFEFAINSPGNIYFLAKENNNTVINITTANGAVPVGVWTHVAIVKNSTTYTIYVNGVSSASGTGGTWTDQSNFWIGRLLGSTPAYDFNGYISNLRVVKGTAVYTSSFTPPTAPLTAITNTSLLTCQSNRFRDASSNNFAITVNGNTSVTNFAPFNPSAAYDPAVNGGSGYFDGTGDYLATPSNAALVMGTGQFWFEAWVYMPAAPSSQYIVLGTNDGSLGSALTVRIQPSALRVDRHGFVAYDSSAVTWQYNAWQHIAVGRDAGNTLYFFVNGQAVGTRASTTDNFAGNSSAIGLIPFDNQPATAFRGYISNARLLKGQCLYTSSFTPPTAPVTAITNTSLLLNFTNAGIVDASAKNDLVTVGNAQISTAQSKFGGSSMAFDGSGDWLSAPSTQELNFGTGNFTVECWVWIDNTGNPGRVDNLKTVSIFTTGSSTSGADALSFAVYGTTSAFGVGLELFQETPRIAFSAAATVATNAWTHVAWVRSGSTFYAFVNGTRYTLGTSTSTVGTGTTPTVGKANYTSYPNVFKGYIDDLRITKGVARYTANFTPPTAPFSLK